VFRFPEAARNFSLEHRDRILTRPPIQWVLVAISPGVKRKCMNLCTPVHLVPRFQKRGAVSPLPNIMASGDPTTAKCNWPHINLSSYDAGSPHHVLTEDQLSFQWSQSHSSTEMFNSPSPAAPAQMQLSPSSSVLKFNKFMGWQHEHALNLSSYYHSKLLLLSSSSLSSSSSGSWYVFVIIVFSVTWITAMLTFWITWYHAQ